MKHPVDTLIDSTLQAPVIRAANQLKAENERLRADLAEAQRRAEADAAIWLAQAHRAARMARQSERHRCAAIAQGLDCQEPPADYRVADPEFWDVSDWERAQCYHGDRIAALILGQE